MFLIGNQEEVKQKTWTRVILSKLRLHTSVTLLYLLGHSERARGKMPSEVPAAGDLGPRAKVGHVAPASLVTKTDLFSYPREGWSFVAVTDLGTLRMTGRVPSATNAVKVFTKDSPSLETFEETWGESSFLSQRRLRVVTFVQK